MFTLAGVNCEHVILKIKLQDNEVTKNWSQIRQSVTESFLLEFFLVIYFSIARRIEHMRSQRLSDSPKKAGPRLFLWSVLTGLRLSPWSVSAHQMSKSPETTQSKDNYAHV